SGARLQEFPCSRLVFARECVDRMLRLVAGKECPAEVAQLTRGGALKFADQAVAHARVELRFALAEGGARTLLLLPGQAVKGAGEVRDATSSQPREHVQDGLCDDDFAR